MNPFKRSKPWPSGHGAVTTRKAPVMKCMEHTWTYSPMNELFDRCRWCGETRARASNPLSSPVETTEPVSGTTSYTGVIRGADEAEAMWAEALRVIQEVLDKRNATIAALTDQCGYERAHITYLTAETERLRGFLALNDVEIDNLTATVLERDATIDRFWAQLNEATNVPDAHTCGGCDGQGSHRKHCRANPNYSREAEWADKAENLGDRIGPNNYDAANACYRAAGLLREPKP